MSDEADTSRIRVRQESVWLIFRRHIWLVLSMVIAAMLLTATVLSLMEPRYVTQATVVLQLPDLPTEQTSGPNETLQWSRSIVETQLDVLRSRAFAARVVEKLSLFDDPRFSAPPDPDAPQTEVAPLQNPVDAVLASYSVSRSGESVAIDIVANYPDANLAADIANTVASTFINDLYGNRLQKTDRAIAANAERVAVLTDEVSQSELELAEFILENGLNDPRMLEDLKAQIDYRSRLLNKTLVGDPDSVESLRVKSELDEAKEALHAQTRAELKRVRLDKSLELLRVRYEEALDRQTALETQRKYLDKGARQISVARVPPEPSWPNIPLALAISGVASLLAGFVLAMLREATDRRIWSDLQLSRGFGLANAGFLPRIANPPGGLSASHVLQHLKNEPDSAFARSARGIVTTLLSGERERPVMMVASGVPGDGASLVASVLAGSASLDGFKVLLVCLGKSGSAAAITAGNEAPARSIPELPWHKTEPTPAPVSVNGEPLPGLDVLQLEMRAPLGGKNHRARLAEMKAKLQREYDLVLVDAPAVLHSDAAVRFGPLVEGVLYVVRWGKTTADELNDSLNRLEAQGLWVSSTVINDIDFQRHRRLGYGGRAHYLADA